MYVGLQLLLSLAKGIFSEQQNLDKLVEKILLDSQELLQCQRCCVYLIEEAIEGVGHVILLCCVYLIEEAIEGVGHVIL